MSAPKTIRVRLAVAVATNGTWSCYGGLMQPDRQPAEDRLLAKLASGWLFDTHDMGHVVFVEAEVPVPELIAHPTIEGKVAL